MLTTLGRLLRADVPREPAGLVRCAGEVSVPLARALEDFLARNDLLPAARQEDDAAAGRRRRRIEAVPAPLRPAVEAFCEHELRGRRRALQAGTRPPDQATIEAHLTVIRDLAKFLTDTTTITDWASVAVGDVEAFLVTQPSTAAHRLSGLHRFFAYAIRRRLILTDPTRGITAAQPIGFRGPTLPDPQQRELFARWTSRRDDVHPHEAVIGLLALVHAATTEEIRGLTVEAIDPATGTVHLSGRPHPTPLDPWTWAAVQDCLAHRQTLPGDNPHLIVTRVTKATRAPASAGYIKNAVVPAGVRPRILRSTRILSLVSTGDLKPVTEALGMTREAVTAYLADHVDLTRLSNL